jgi:hypothetical protein
MTIKDPSNWGNDPLSDFIKGAYENTFATFVNMKPDFDKLRRIDASFRKAVDCLYNTPDWFIGFFLLRSHSSYLAAARLSMSGQVYESYMVLRGCLESALYGFFVAKNEDAKKIWMERHENEQALKLMKKSFQMRVIFSLLNNTDEKVYHAIQDLYDRTIDYGAHPNPNGALSNLRINENEQDIQFQMSYLTNDPLQIHLALRTTAQIGIGALMLYRFVYPERFAITGLYDELVQLSKDL